MCTHSGGEKQAYTEMISVNERYDVVLASNSPRRRELLAGMGVDFRVEVISGIDETYPDTLPVEQVAEYLSGRKAQAYELRPNELLITADTVVISDGRVLGKPADEAEARVMLRELSGKSHRVITGVTLRSMNREVRLSDVSEVDFAELTEDEIEHYVKRYRPLDKAGAYGIQEWIGYVGITGIRGSFYNVMGLPTRRLYEELKRF